MNTSTGTSPASESVPNSVQESMQEDRNQETNATKKRKFDFSFFSFSLNTKIVILLAISLLLFAIFAIIISHNIFTKTFRELQQEFAYGMANLAATSINPDRVQDYLEKGELAEGYLETKKKLTYIKNSMSSIKYIYVYKILPDGCHVVFDLDIDGQPGEKPGTVIPFDKAFEPYLPTLLAGGSIGPIVSDERYGWLLTVYVPVRDSKGVCQCYAAADVSMNWLRDQTNEYLVKLIITFFAIFIILLIFTIWRSKANITDPINSIAQASKTFAFDDNSSVEDNLKLIRSLKIKTGDEVENLYNAFVKMAKDSVRYVSDIRRKNAEIAKMQNALIVTLADMVESRDLNTGQHIRKTAAYTRVIMAELKQEGVYAEFLTDTFVEDVVNSAPLHDIGKIHVPDAILNKPGKLTDEEFELMKSHTSTGGKIISRIMQTVPHTRYLKEACNLATYHHEKWNGRGYPTGLSGEDIPLSARIMAVADVFDALVSNRSYKKGFPYEKAFAIIEEESGTHFDPKIVQAFFAVQDKIIAIADHFSRIEKGEIPPSEPPF